MRKRFNAVLIATAFSLAAIGAAPAAASAKELQPPSPPPQPVYSWTGWHAGGNFGWGWMRSDVSIAPADAATAAVFGGGIAAGTLATSLHDKDQGVVGGGQLGYNWQIQRIVLGIEADYQAMRLDGFDQILGAPKGFVPILNDYNSRITSLGTIRARGGFAIAPDLLAYATGGFAFGGVQSHWDIAFMEPGPGIRYFWRR